MAQMLRHKETGELFVYTDLLSRLSELELVVEDPVAAVIAEEKAKIQAEVPAEELEIPVFAPAEVPAGKPANREVTVVGNPNKKAVRK